eukprot:8529463-Pyramimonas_sp.AAC.1
MAFRISCMSSRFTRAAGTRAAGCSLDALERLLAQSSFKRLAPFRRPPEKAGSPRSRRRGLLGHYLGTLVGVLGA